MKYFWESWPESRAMGEKGPLSPGALSVDVGETNARSGIPSLRRYVPDHGLGLAVWPAKTEGVRGRTPAVFLSSDASCYAAELWMDIEGVDGQDVLLGRAMLGMDTGIAWIHEPSAGSEGEVVRILADATLEALTDRSVEMLVPGEVIALPGPRAPAGFDEPSPSSWHAAEGADELRALEIPPIQGVKDGELRARRALLRRPMENPGEGAGVALWDNSSVRIWSSDRHPLVDPPLTRQSLSPATRLLADYLEEDER